MTTKFVPIEDLVDLQLRAEKAELSLPDLFESDVFEEVPIGASALRDGAA